MINMLKNWTGTVEINGKTYDTVESAISDFKPCEGAICIKLYPRVKEAQNTPKSSQISVQTPSTSTELKITVKKYMLEPASPSFDFMQKWNDNNPMPMRTMQGVILQETRGMVKMKLHGLALPTITCSCCNRELTNPVSRHYGIGPICLAKLGITRDIEDVENIREELTRIEWTGWVIKSAITEREEVEV